MEEQKGANATTVMIDTTGSSKEETPKQTPMLKLGRKRLGAQRTNTEDEETKDPRASDQQLICPFRECGRKFVSDTELKNHMQRRHRPAAQQESVDTTEAQALKETPVPVKSKANFATGKLQVIQNVQLAPKQQESSGFKDAGQKQQSYDFDGAKPKVVAQRPGTAMARGGPMPQQQADLLRAMMHHQPPGARKGPSGMIQRPHTAATSTMYDEKRIKDKMKYLDDVFSKIDEEVLKTADKIDIDFFRGQRNPALKDPQAAEKQGVKLTKQMVLDNSLMCDNLEEVTTLMVRDKMICRFDDNLEDEDNRGNKFKLNDLCNIECLMASHNLIKDISGILQLTTLVELNISYNMISDIQGIDELTQLKSLHLNHNKISMIDPIAKLLNLKTLGLFYNDLLDGEHAMSILIKCKKLREVSLDGNPCARTPEFGYELLLRLPDLKVFNEEAIKELDRDVAEQYYEMYELPRPQPYKPEVAIESKLKMTRNADGEKEKKCVRFTEVNADDIEECGHEKDMKRLHQQIQELELDKFKLQQKLTVTKYDEVYKENDRLQMQLTNMYNLMDENEQMRAELDALRASTFEERTADVADDNKRLRRRNGELQIELMDTKAELKKLKQSVAHLPNDASPMQQALLMGAASSGSQARPQTAAVRSKPLEEQWLSDPNFDIKHEQDDIDRELAEMMKRNQERLAELRGDFKQVSKLVDEPYVNVRKVKQPSVASRKMRDQQPIRDGAVDENVDAV